MGERGGFTAVMGDGVPSGTVMGDVFRKRGNGHPFTHYLVFSGPRGETLWFSFFFPTTHRSQTTGNALLCFQYF